MLSVERPTEQLHHTAKPQKAPQYLKCEMSSRP